MIVMKCLVATDHPVCSWQSSSRSDKYSDDKKCESSRAVNKKRWLLSFIFWEDLSLVKIVTCVVSLLKTIHLGGSLLFELILQVSFINRKSGVKITYRDLCWQFTLACYSWSWLPSMMTTHDLKEKIPKKRRDDWQ